MTKLAIEIAERVGRLKALVADAPAEERDSSIFKHGLLACSSISGVQLDLDDILLKSVTVVSGEKNLMVSPSVEAEGIAIKQKQISPAGSRGHVHEMDHVDSSVLRVAAPAKDEEVDSVKKIDKAQVSGKDTDDEDVVAKYLNTDMYDKHDVVLDVSNEEVTGACEKIADSLSGIGVNDDTVKGSSISKGETRVRNSGVVSEDKVSEGRGHLLECMKYTYVRKSRK